MRSDKDMTDWKSPPVLVCFRMATWFDFDASTHYIIIIENHLSKHYWVYAMKNVLIYEFEREKKGKTLFYPLYHL